MGFSHVRHVLNSENANGHIEESDEKGEWEVEKRGGAQKDDQCDESYEFDDILRLRLDELVAWVGRFAFDKEWQK